MLLPAKAGELWYVNTDLTHSVRNLSTQDRIHLVIDCAANDWLYQQLGITFPLHAAGIDKETPNNSPFTTIKSAIENILNTDNNLLHQNKPIVDSMIASLCLLTGIDPYPAIFLDENSTITKGGKAVSCITAARCGDDYMRTQIFLKGIYQAIRDRILTHEKINILYAGTGPHGLLLVPLLHLLPMERLHIVMMDVHHDSIDALKRLLEKSGLDQSNVDIVCCDALEWDPTPVERFDIIISETMLAMLKHEPQVSIFRHLYPFLEDDGVLIPQSIDIDIRALSEGQTAKAQKLHLGNICRLNKDTLSNSWIENDIPLHGRLSLQFPQAQQYSRLQGVTTIHVYEQHKLLENQSGLTIPCELGDFESGKHAYLEYQYRLGEFPGFDFWLTAFDPLEATVC